MTNKILYIEDLAALFSDVQLSGLFPDQKVLPDSTPKREVQEILAEYSAEKNGRGFNLLTFVHRNFHLPSYLEKKEEFKGHADPEMHIRQLWAQLTRRPAADNSSIISLPNAYVVPGGRFEEMFYWDTYFTMLGLQVSGEKQLILNMVENFAFLIDTYGHIPNGNRSYFLSRSQPPFFSLMVELLSEEFGDEVYKKYLPQLIAEYNFWMEDDSTLSKEKPCSKRVVLMPGGEILNRYWDDKNEPRPEGFTEDKSIFAEAKDKENIYRNIRAACESGWDFSGRWFSDHKNMATINAIDMLPVDLNCLLFHLEQVIASASGKGGDTVVANAFQLKAEKRKDALLKYLWSEDAGCFCDYIISSKATSSYFTMAMAYPLFFRVSNEAQANATLKVMEERFLQKGGLLTTLANTGQQWDAPNGWAPLQWIGYKAAQNFNNNSLAEKIRQNWTKNVEKVFAATGKMMEKYNVADTSTNAGGGEYPNQDGFGWTNGVYLKMKAEQASENIIPV
jgi:alpha,alpha-trehalase